MFPGYPVMPSGISLLMFQAVVKMVQQFLAQLGLLVLRSGRHAFLCQLDEGLL